jgi:hypothetical protein
VSHFPAFKDDFDRKNPEVREAAEKALITLRTMRGLK